MKKMIFGRNAMGLNFSGLGLARVLSLWALDFFVLQIFKLGF
jgi:hypothetical protein